MAIFGPNPWVNPFEKCQFFDFLNFLFLQLRKACIGSRISLKTFSWLILPTKKNLEKWAFLSQNHALTPLEKCQFFYFLNFLFLQLRKGLFGSRISLKTFSWLILPKKNPLTFFWPILSEKKSWKNGYFLGKNHGLTPLEKRQFFDFVNFLFLQSRKAFFGSRISLKTFSWAILPKKEKLEKWPFLGQIHGLTPLKNVNFSNF